MSRRRLAWLLNLVGGPVVLGTYAYGILTHTEPGRVLWGNLPPSLQGVYTASMLAAAAGYFPMLLYLTARADEPTARGVPLAFLLMLLPSALWMPLTFAHHDAPSALKWALVRAVLFMVALGSISLLRLTIRVTPRARGRTLAIVGSTIFALHTGLLDAIIWPALY